MKLFRTYPNVVAALFGLLVFSTTLLASEANTSSGAVIAGDYRGSGLPRSGGPVDDGYFGGSEPSEWSDFAALETGSSRLDHPDRRRPWTASDLPKSGGHIEDWYRAAP